MKALLLQPWNGYQPGQILTQYPPEAIPPHVAAWFGDDEVVPALLVLNGRIDPNAPELAGHVHAQADPAPPSVEPESPPVSETD